MLAAKPDFIPALINFGLTCHVLGQSQQAEAIQIAADTHAQKARIAAQGDADAEKLHADAQRALYEVEAEGKRAVNEAANILSAEQIAMQVRLKLIESLPQIIAESVKPIKNIDGIKIVQVDGLSGNGAQGAEVPNGCRSLADQVASSALKYRTQATLLDAMLKEIGLEGGNINGLTDALTVEQAPTDANPLKPKQ